MVAPPAPPPGSARSAAAAATSSLTPSSGRGVPSSTVVRCELYVAVHLTDGTVTLRSDDGGGSDAEVAVAAVTWEAWQLEGTWYGERAATATAPALSGLVPQRMMGMLGSLTVCMRNPSEAPPEGYSRGRPSVAELSMETATNAVLQLLPCAAVLDGSCAVRVEWIRGGASSDKEESVLSTALAAERASTSESPSASTSRSIAPWYVRGRVTAAVGTVRAVHPPGAQFTAVVVAARVKGVITSPRAAAAPVEVVEAAAVETMEEEAENDAWGDTVATLLTQMMVHTTEVAVEVGPCSVATLALPQPHSGDGSGVGANSAVVIGFVSARCLLADPLGAAAAARAAKTGATAGKCGERIVTATVEGVCTAVVRGTDRQDVLRRYGVYTTAAENCPVEGLVALVPPFSAHVQFIWQAMGLTESDHAGGEMCRLEGTASVDAMQLGAGGAEAATAAAAVAAALQGTTSESRRALGRRLMERVGVGGADGGTTITGAGTLRAEAVKVTFAVDAVTDVEGRQRLQGSRCVHISPASTPLLRLPTASVLFFFRFPTVLMRMELVFYIAACASRQAPAVQSGALRWARQRRRVQERAAARRRRWRCLGCWRRGTARRVAGSRYRR